MNGSKRKGYLTGACSHCGGRLEFPVDLVGTMAACPHCHQHTELLLESPSSEETVSRKAVVWAVVGAMVLILGLGVPLWGLRWASRHRQQLAAQIAPGLECSALIVEKSPDASTVNVSGELGNNSDRKRTGIRMQFNLYDATGRKVGTGAAFQSALDPGARAQFKVSAAMPQATSARVISIREGQAEQP